MNFNKHSLLPGSHARLSPSNHAWLGYDEEKMAKVFFTAMAAQRGTELHAFAAEAIRLSINLPDDGKTLSMYVNDAIGFKMTPEQTLFYSENSYGTADAIAFRANKLRIADFKSGALPTSVKQLIVYAALFCLEYGYKPFDIEIEMIIYQNNEARVYKGDPVEVAYVMDRIVTLDKYLKTLKAEVS